MYIVIIIISVMWCLLILMMTLTVNEVLYILKTSSPSSICLCVFTTSKGVVINAANCQTTKNIFTNCTPANK